MTGLEIRNIYREHFGEIKSPYGGDSLIRVVAAILTLAQVISQAKPVSAVLEERTCTPRRYGLSSSEGPLS